MSRMRPNQCQSSLGDSADPRIGESLVSSSKRPRPSLDAQGWRELFVSRRQAMQRYSDVLPSAVGGECSAAVLDVEVVKRTCGVERVAPGAVSILDPREEPAAEE